MKASEILFWFFMILGFMLLIWYFLGRSPLIEQIFIAFLSGIVIKLYDRIEKTNDKIHNLELRIMERLSKIERKISKKR